MEALEVAALQRRQYVDRARVTATPDGPSAQAIEAAWERQHPEGRVDLIDDRQLDLWNYGVGLSSLKPEHDFALTEFLKRHRIELLSGRAMLRVTGAASGTGTRERDRSLANERAQDVVQRAWYRVMGVSAVLEVSEPASSSAADGEELARTRRVTLRVEPVVTEPGPRPPSAPSSPPPGLTAAPPPVPTSATASGQPPAPDAPDPTFQVEPVGEVGLVGRVVIKLNSVALNLGKFGTARVGGEIVVVREAAQRERDVRIDVRQTVDLFRRDGKRDLVVWIEDDVRIILGNRLAIGGSIGPALIEFELAADPDFPWSFAVSTEDALTIAQLVARHRPLTLGGVQVQIVSLKLRLNFAPSPWMIAACVESLKAVAARIAPWLARAGTTAVAAATSPATVVVAGTTAAFLGFVALDLLLTQRAHEAGIGTAILNWIRYGYADRLAERAMSKPATPDLARGYDGQAQDLGRNLADVAFDNLSENDRALLTEAIELCTKNKQAPLGEAHLLRQWVQGASSESGLPDPQKIIERAERERDRFLHTK